MTRMQDKDSHADVDEAKTFDLVTLGEALVQLNATTPGPLRQARSFEVHAAGSELNVGVAAARLGLRVQWIGALGADGFGDMVLSAIRAEGIDASSVVRTSEAPTGVFFVERGYPSEGYSSSYYYRAGSAGSRLSADDLQLSNGSGTIVHVSGISIAVSPMLAGAVHAAVADARRSGALASFDVNFRSRLWSADEARPEIERALAQSDVAFCSLADARSLWGVDNPTDAADLLAGFGPSLIAVSCGADGALLREADAPDVVAEAVPTRVLDPTGAGDAFCATVLTGVVRRWPMELALQRACVAGSMVCGVLGDQAGAPTLDELVRAADGTWVHR